MHDPSETELKLEVDPLCLATLEAANLLKPSETKTRHLVSTYFDTPDFALRDAGYSLRIRRSGQSRIQTVKADGIAAAGLFVRAEWEQAIKGDWPRFDETNNPLTHRIGVEILDRIGALFVTDIERITQVVHLKGTVVNLDIDNGEIRAGGRTEAICEIELELVSGAPQPLFEFARRISKVTPLRIGVRSKAERGYNLIEGPLGTALKPDPIMLDPVDAAGEAFQQIARSCIRQFRLNEALLLATGGQEPLHQARVGLRRLRSALSLCGRLLEQDPQAKTLAVEIRWLAAKLGRVRNLDVLIPKVEKCATDALIQARVRLLAEARIALGSERARDLMMDLVEWLSIGAWRSRPSEPALLDQNVMIFAANILEERRKRLKKRGAGLSGLDDNHRHKVRIEVKKLRYATEFFAALHTGPKARHRQTLFTAALEELQDCLGELNDMIAGPRALSALALDPRLFRCGKPRRQRLLERAENAYDALLDVKRYWLKPGAHG